MHHGSSRMEYLRRGVSPANFHTTPFPLPMTYFLKLALVQPVLERLAPWPVCDCYSGSSPKAHLHCWVTYWHTVQNWKHRVRTNPGEMTWQRHSRCQQKCFVNGCVHIPFLLILGALRVPSEPRRWLRAWLLPLVMCSGSPLPVLLIYLDGQTNQGTGYSLFATVPKIQGTKQK